MPSVVEVLRILTLAWLLTCLAAGGTADAKAAEGLVEEGPTAGSSGPKAAAAVEHPGWLTYRGDARRSGKTSETLDIARLQPHWNWRSPSPPQPAWSGPAKWDAYAGIEGLRSMRDYDPVFHVVADSTRVYFGSSVDDGVHCLNAYDGRDLWTYTTDGPVRVPPTIEGDRLYFGSDDGFAYCLATDGRLRWRFQPGHDPRRILNNGRLISTWPCRTGVVVRDGTAYFANSLLPWKSSFLCAVNAETGRPEGDGRYVRELANQTMEGPLVVSDQQVIVPQGRIPPRLFRRADGEQQGELKGGGGCFVVLASDDLLLHGPGNKTGWITASQTAGRDVVATFPQGNAMVVDGPTSYILTDDAVICGDFVNRAQRWKTACRFPYSMILAGDTLLLGGDDEVAALDASSGKIVWRHAVAGRAYGLAVAGGRLLVSTDQGAVTCFAAGPPVVDVARQSAPEVAVNPRPAEEATAPRTPASDSDAPGDEPVLVPVPTVEDADLFGRWVFQAPHLQDSVVRDLAGQLPATISGSIATEFVGRHQALRLDGKSQRLVILEDIAGTALPAEQLTAEAWVRIDRPLEWGGIVGAIQDNGSFERGWLLGYREDRFCLGICGKQGPGRLTYLTSPVKFETRRWYHVAGTYDGQTMKLFVDGRLSASSEEQRGPIFYPPSAFFEMGAYHDKDEQFRATGLLHEVRVYRRALQQRELLQNAVSRALESNATAELASGPWLRFETPTTAIVGWRTATAQPSVVRLRQGDRVRTLRDEAASTTHQITLTGLRHKRLEEFSIQVAGPDQPGWTGWFACDTFFNYCPPVVSQEFPVANGVDEKIYVESAARILGQTGVDRGICLVLGGGDGRLASQLVAKSRLRCIVVDTDPERVSAARQLIASRGIYGSRVTVHQVASLARLPFTSCFANLIVSQQSQDEGQIPSSRDEVFRLLRPDGGVALLGQSATAADNRLTSRQAQEWLDGNSASARDAGAARVETTDGCWIQLVRPALPGAGEWSHLYGLADNSAFGGESLAGASQVDDLDVQWIGRPGARYQADRSGRKPSPLSTAGRLFLQGDQRLIAADAFNGSILWSMEIPRLGRYNMPRDCSNWCADRSHVFVAVAGECWQLDAANGNLVRRHPVQVPRIDNEPKAGGTPGPDAGGTPDIDAAEPDATTDAAAWDWGFVARQADRLLGSSVRRGAAFDTFWGGAGWYDAAAGEVTHKICSDRLFALDAASGEPAWSYSRGVQINSTITVSADHVYFVECRHPRIVADSNRRVGAPELWQQQFLVALRLSDGTLDWERPIDTPDGTVVFYLAHGHDTLALVGSGARQYHVNVFDARQGEPRWNTSFRWPSDNHGGHMARPAIVNHSLYVRPRAFELATGLQYTVQMPGGGCGTYAATTEALFFRSGNVTVWDRQTAASTQWTRLRPDCWLSTIPSAGMLLSPEGGGGCSCGSWMETSLGFLPKDLAAPPRTPATK